MIVEPTLALPALSIAIPAPHHVIGSVIGTLESLNVHGKREASLYNELDRRRVVVSFPEVDYTRVHAALRRRVEIFGMVQEDPNGRPLRLRLQDLTVMRADDELPTLGSLAGSMPNLTRDTTAEEHLERNRRELGLADHYRRPYLGAQSWISALSGEGPFADDLKEVLIAADRSELAPATAAA